MTSSGGIFALFSTCMALIGAISLAVWYFGEALPTYQQTMQSIQSNPNDSTPVVNGIANLTKSAVREQIDPRGIVVGIIGAFIITMLILLGCSLRGQGV